MQTFLVYRVEELFPNSFCKESITENQTSQKRNYTYISLMTRLQKLVTKYEQIKSSNT